MKSSTPSAHPIAHPGRPRSVSSAFTLLSALAWQPTVKKTMEKRSPLKLFTWRWCRSLWGNKKAPNRTKKSWNVKKSSPLEKEHFILESGKTPPGLTQFLFQRIGVMENLQEIIMISCYVSHHPMCTAGKCLGIEGIISTLFSSCQSYC